MRSSLASICFFAVLAFAGMRTETAAAASEASPESSASGASASVGHFGADWGNASAWRPSLAVGVGVASRGGEGAVSIVGLNTAPGGAQNRKTESSSKSFATDGIDLPVEASLMLPAFTSLPGKPRLFVSGGYVPDLFKLKFAGSVGYEPADWGQGIEYYRVEQTVDQKSAWYAGVGANFLLPIDAYPVRLGASLRYYEDRVDIDRRILISTLTGTPPPPNYIVEESTIGVVREIAPGVVLDVDFDRRGPVLIGFYMEMHVGIALQNDGSASTILGPLPGGPSQDPGTANFEYVADDIRYTGSLGLRLTWSGW